jgi:hypothetical protein
LTELTPCEFFLFRYVPDVVKDEFVNIGVLLRSVGDSPQPLLRFTRDWSRVQGLHHDADTDLLEALEGDISKRLLTESADIVLEELLESLSNSIQIVGPHACLAVTLEPELNRLMRLYVEPPSIEASIPYR